MTGNIEDYEVLEVIGTGSFGTCYKVRNKLSARIFVWKAIDYGSMSEEKKQVGLAIYTYKKVSVCKHINKSQLSVLYKSTPKILFTQNYSWEKSHLYQSNKQSLL